MNNPRLFLHRATGYALGGTLAEPEQAVIKPQACVALPSIGGFDSSEAERFSHPGISFQSAQTHVIGISRRNKSNIYETQVQTTIQGLNVQGVIRAESIAARLVVTTNDTDLPGLGPRPRFSFAGTWFQGLTVDGESYDLRSSAHFDTVLTRMENLFDRCKNGGVRLASTLSDHSGALHRQASTNNIELVSRAGQIDASEIEKSEVQAIHVAGFGKVCLAELLYNPFVCHLAILRVELDGAGFDGDMLIGAVEGGASCFPGHRS